MLHASRSNNAGTMEHKVVIKQAQSDYNHMVVSLHNTPEGADYIQF